MVVSVVHFAKENNDIACELDDKRVKRISAFLLASDLDDDPRPLAESTGLGFLGTKVQGIGFVFDDDNPECPPVSLLEGSLAKNPKCGKFVRPYIGGEELNSLPVTVYPRKVIDFGDLDESEARRFPELMRVVEEYVLPQRKGKQGSLGKKWWQFGHRALELYHAIADLRRVIVVARVSKTLAFTFIDTGGVINDKIIAFRFDHNAAFAALQSRMHEIWTRTFSSTLKDDLQYTPSDCLVTFPFPENFETDAKLEAVGKEYYEFRAALMVKNNEGLTKTYNRFHDPNETSAEIKKLRELHTAMDRAVLDAYGWKDLPPTCEFLLDYDEEEDEDAEDRPTGRARKKPWRYRWPDEFRDTVLARLLELNKQRAEQEKLSGEAADKKEAKAPAKKGRAKKQQSNISDMFSEQRDETS